MKKEDKKEEDKEKEKIPLYVNNALPNYFVDNMRISARDDGNCVISFFTGLAEGSFEQTRIITPTDRLKAFVDLICKQVDHYPIKMEEDETPKTKEKKRSPKKT